MHEICKIISFIKAQRKKSNKVPATSDSCISLETCYQLKKLKYKIWKQLNLHLTKCLLWHTWAANALIRLLIHAVRSVFSLCLYMAMYGVFSEDSDQTAGYAGLSESLLGAHFMRYVFGRFDTFMVNAMLHVAFSISAPILWQRYLFTLTIMDPSFFHEIWTL